MKNLLFLIACLVFQTAVSGQSPLLIEPGEVDTIARLNLSDNDLEIWLPLKLTNVSKDSLYLKWSKKEVLHPEGWEAKVCDKVNCYPSSIFTNYDPAKGIKVPVEMAAGESFLLYITLLPHNTPGMGKYEIPFSYISDPDSIIGSAKFNFDVNQLTSPVKKVEKIATRVFPNPAVEYFEVEASRDLKSLVVYNVLGRQIKSFPYEPGQRYHIAELPSGMYLLSFQDKNNKILKTVRLAKKASARP